MPQSPYEILGVARDASQEDIRKAYKRLAKQLHPDLNPGDATAEERFKTVSQAYQVVGDAERRGRFDRGEIDAQGAEAPPRGFYREHAGGEHPYHTTGGFADFGDLGDIFSDLFGRGQGPGGAVHGRGGDIGYRLDVDFMDAARGAATRVRMADGRMLDVRIPPGVRNGQVLRLAGQGWPGHGDGKPGDALIEIHVGPHPAFRRDGLDIHLELPVALDEAVLGAKVDVPTIHGRVSMGIPKGSNSGRVLRLRGRGIHAGDREGDQLVTLRIVLPRTIDADLETFLREWRRSHAYDPRADQEERNHA
jgi:DnaJ-class molecular chaperone